MNVAVALLNMALGLVYTSYGLMTWFDLHKNWDSRGRSHFGLAWIAMAFTCGPHHFEHGLHILTTSRPGGSLDFAAVLIGVPAGVTWFFLRVEAMRGGPGDRTTGPLPAWVESIPTIALTYLLAISAAVLITLGRADITGFDARLTPNLLLVGLYVAIGVVLLKTQLMNRRLADGWSLSGLALSVVFPTCAIMHGIWAVYGATGYYDIDGHLLTIDVLAVPAAAYFLWVVWSLSTGRLTDWSSAAADATTQTAEQAPVAVGN